MVVVSDKTWQQQQQQFNSVPIKFLCTVLNILSLLSPGLGGIMYREICQALLIDSVSGVCGTTIECRSICLPQ